MNLKPAATHKIDPGMVSDQVDQAFLSAQAKDRTRMIWLGVLGGLALGFLIWGVK